MQNNRNFINYKKLKTGKKFITYTFKSRAHTFYQKSNKTYKLLAASSNTIEEPFFQQFLKVAKKYKRLSFFVKSKSLNFYKTSKPNGIRMGKGKGKIKHRISMVKKNQSLVTLREINDVSLYSLFKLLKGKVSYKLSFTSQRDTF